MQHRKGCGAVGDVAEKNLGVQGMWHVMGGCWGMHSPSLLVQGGRELAVEDRGGDGCRHGGGCLVIWGPKGEGWGPRAGGDAARRAGGGCVGRDPRCRSLAPSGHPAGTDAAPSRGQSFNTYFSNEHSRLLTLWRQVVAFRRHFGEMKATTERSGGSPGGLGVGFPKNHWVWRGGRVPSCISHAGIYRS